MQWINEDNSYGVCSLLIQTVCSLLIQTACSLLIQTAPCAPTRAGTPPFLTRFSWFSLMTPNIAEFLNFRSVSAEVSTEVSVLLGYYATSLLHWFPTLRYSVVPKRRTPIIQWRGVASQKNGQHDFREFPGIMVSFPSKLCPVYLLSFTFLFDCIYLRCWERR